MNQNGVHAKTLSPHLQAGQRAAACLTAHCACRRHLPWLLDVGGGDCLQQGRKDPSGNPGRTGRESETKGGERPLAEPTRV